MPKQSAVRWISAVNMRHHGLLSVMWHMRTSTKRDITKINKDIGGCCAERQWRRLGGYWVLLCRKTEDHKKRAMWR